MSDVTREENTISHLEALVFEAMGEVSMCWSERPKGVFESEKAVEIGRKLIADIQKEFEPSNSSQPSGKESKQ